MITVFAVLSLVASFLAIFLANAVYHLDRKKTLNLIFAVFCFFLAYWCFTEFMCRQADNAATAYLWMKLEFVWPIPTVLTFHFALLFTEKINLLKNKLVYVLLYAPCVVFSYIYLTTDWITAGVTQKFWGYTYVTADTWVTMMSDAWAFVLTFSAIIICLIQYLKAREKNRRQQAKFVTLGFLIPVFIAFLSEGVFLLWHIDFPELTTVATLVLGVFVGFAIWRYQLFSLNPATAAETIISTMSDPLLLTDQQGRIIKVNQALTQFLDVPEKQLLKKQIAIIFTEGQIIKTAIKTDQTQNELKLTNRRGQEKYAVFSCAEVKAENGAVIGAVYIFHDITQRKELEARLLKAERFAAIGELAGMVGHDLRNPLTGIKNAAYYLKKKGPTISPAQAVEMFQVIENCIAYSNKIITDLLDYSKDVHLILHESSALSLSSKSLKGMQIPDRIQVENLTTDSPVVLVDEDKIERVLVNLIKNAIDAMPDGGKITIASREVEQNLEISVADTGTGIPEEIRPMVFTPLFTTKAQGMGFGLAICRRIIEEHGGTITLESTLGQGSVFKIHLPIEANRQVNSTLVATPKATN